MFLNLFGDYKSFDVCIIIYESWIQNPIFNQKYGEIRVYSLLFGKIHILLVIIHHIMYDSYHMTHANSRYFKQNQCY